MAFPNMGKAMASTAVGLPKKPALRLPAMKKPAMKPQASRNALVSALTGGMKGY